MTIAVAAAFVFLVAYRAQKIVVIFNLALAAGLLIQAWPLVSKSEWLVVTDEVEIGLYMTGARTQEVVGA